METDPFAQIKDNSFQEKVIQDMKGIKVNVFKQFANAVAGTDKSVMSQDYDDETLNTLNGFDSVAPSEDASASGTYYSKEPGDADRYETTDENQENAAPTMEHVYENIQHIAPVAPCIRDKFQFMRLHQKFSSPSSDDPPDPLVKSDEGQAVKSTPNTAEDKTQKFGAVSATGRLAHRQNLAKEILRRRAMGVSNRRIDP
jgi:hypothetical protein